MPPAPATNPWLLSPAELRSLMAGRERELGLLVESLLADRAARVVLTGEAGSGRSFLLARLAVVIAEEPALAARYAPIRLEALHFLGGTAALGEAALAALAALERDRGHAARAESLRVGPEGRLTGESWEILRSWTRVEGRGLVLLVDDLDLGLDALEDGGKALWATLGAEPGLALVGAARHAPQIPGHPAPAALIGLEPLADAAARELLSRLAAPRGAAGALELLGDAGRARALLALAGGNPGALVQLFEVLALGDARDVGEVAERWLDRASPVYALRLDALAAQARWVATGLARRGDPCTAAELAADLGLDVNAISSQLSRLGKIGAVERVELPDSGRTGFQLADRRFDAWLRARVAVEARGELAERVRFLALLHGAEAGEARLGRRVPAAWAIEEGPAPVRWGALAGSLDAPSGVPADVPLPREDEISGPGVAAGWGRIGDLRKNVLRHHAEAEEAYQRALGLDRGLGWVWNNLGNLARHAFARPDAAEAAYRGAIAASPELAVAWLNLGNVLAAEAGRLEEAEAALRRALALDPGRAEAWASLGELLALAGRGREALAALEESLARDPLRPALWQALARLREEHATPAAAEQAWREAVRRAPEDADASTGLGLWLARRGLATAAERALRRAISLRARSPLAWRALGELLSNNEARLAEAEAALRQARETAPFGAFEMSAELGLAWFLLATGRAPEEAEARAEELARRVGAVGPVAVLVGARLKRGAWAEAVPLIRRVLVEGPWNDATFHVALGWLVEGARAGRAAEAAALLEAAGLARAWRPLHECLLAAAGDVRRLERLGPETRGPAEILLARIRPPRPEPEAATPGARRGRRARRAW